MSTPTLKTPIETPDQEFDTALRPKTLDEYVGQSNTKKNLAILTQAARKRKDPLDHVLLYGPSGLGKTTLAHIIAREFGSGLRVTSGTALEKAGDIGSILTGLGDGDFLFIDEVHRLNKSVEETLYPAMENYKLDIIIGKGTAAKTLQVALPKFSIIAATTRISLLSNPFRSRFGAQYKLDFYTDEDIVRIIKRSAKLLDVSIDDKALSLVARSARYTPRIANHLLKRVRDYAQVKGIDRVDEPSAHAALDLLGIDEKGLGSTDRSILKTILTEFKGGPAGLKSIAASIAEEEDTIEEVYEPYLMRIGFMTRTARGRMITEAGIAHVAESNSKRPTLL
ncbi:MAG: Holliday junction branch migration DNA helicase RuvB [Parcubacteria group bacterium]